MQMDSWLPFKYNITPARADHLGNARACIVHGAEHGAVPLASPTAGVRSLSDGTDLVARQKADHWPVKSLQRDRERPFDRGQGIDVVMSGIF